MTTPGHAITKLVIPHPGGGLKVSSFRYQDRAPPTKQTQIRNFAVIFLSLHMRAHARSRARTNYELNTTKNYQHLLPPARRPIWS